ncbi:MAG: hemolysin III family protein [Pirellulales bacterium]|nr:hemolysin III family protein [Pirellulales bacterium]
MATQESLVTLQPRAVSLPWEPETANALTHGLGCVLGLIGAAVLLTVALHSADPWRVAAAVVFGGTLIGVYTASTLSHVVTRPRPRHAMRRLDQAAIYLFIAGSYTPFALVFLRTGPWSTLLYVIWAIAAVGFILKLFFGHQVESVTTGLYLFLGWLPALAAWPLIGVVTPPGLLWMLYGGLCYTAGIFFLKLDRVSPYFHALWHLAVLAGSAWHYFAILDCVIGVY